MGYVELLNSPERHDFENTRDTDAKLVLICEYDSLHQYPIPHKICPSNNGFPIFYDDHHLNQEHHTDYVAALRLEPTIIMSARNIANIGNTQRHTDTLLSLRTTRPMRHGSVFLLLAGTMKRAVSAPGSSGDPNQRLLLQKWSTRSQITNAKTPPCLPGRSGTGSWPRGCATTTASPASAPSTGTAPPLNHWLNIVF